MLKLENLYFGVPQGHKRLCAMNLIAVIVQIQGLVLKIAIAKTPNESAPVTCFGWVTGVVDRDKPIDSTMMIATTIGQLSSRYGIVWFAIPVLMMLCSSSISIRGNGNLSMKVHPSPTWNEHQCLLRSMVI